MKRTLLLPSLALALILQGRFAPAVAAAETIHYVDNQTLCLGLEPCYPTIMEALEAAADSSIIEVFPGVYHEEVVFDDKAGIVLRAHDAAAMPVIAAPPDAASAVTVDATSGIQILGFVLEAPAAAIVARHLGSMGTVIESNIIRSGNGITMYDTGLVIRNNTIEGGGVNAELGGNANLIEGNTIEGDIRIGESNVKAMDNVIRSNFVHGSIAISGGLPVGLIGAQGNVVESNLVVDGSIRLVLYRGQDNLIRGNVVRGGDIEVGHGAAHNTIEGNFVSGSSGDGIRANSYGDPGSANNGGDNVFRGNTSVENVDCDLNDTSDPDNSFPNSWLDNRVVTRCGAAQDCTAPTAWYRDGDADGFGAAGDRQLTCARPSGFVGAAGDCDDASPTAYPGASEVCDGRDDDCNGVVDDAPSATASCDDGDDCTIDACRAGACSTSPAIIPRATCTASPGILNFASNGTPFGLTVALTDRCTGLALEPMRLTALSVAAVASPSLGRAILPTPTSEPGCTQDGIWETLSQRQRLDAGVMTTSFQAPSDGRCATLDGNRQDIIRLLGNARNGEKAVITFAAGYPGAADRMTCAAIVVVRIPPTR